MVVVSRNKDVGCGVVERVAFVVCRGFDFESCGVVGLDGVGDAAKSSGEAQGLFEDEVVVALSFIITDVHANVTKGIAV